MPSHIPFLDMAAPGFSTRSDAVINARADNWCAKTPYGLAVLRHNEVGRLLRDRRLRQGSYAWPDTNCLEGSFAEFWKRSIISQEGNIHRQLRAIAVPSLAPEYVTSLIPTFDGIAETLAADITSLGACEFMQDFSIPFASQAICVLLGLQVEDWPLISQDAYDLGLAMGVDCKHHEAVFNAAHDRLAVLADGLIQKVRDGRDTSSYVARLISNFDKYPELDHQAQRDMIVISIFGGVDTTRAQLGFAVNLFINHEDQWKILRQNRELIPQAIDEIIRANPTTTWSTREAVEDFEFGGQHITKGQTLHMLVHSSALDPAICDAPDFDITQRRITHFGFGGGAHHCLGQLVARTDMTSALNALADRVEGFEYWEPPAFLPDSGNTSPVRLPVRCIPT